MKRRGAAVNRHEEIGIAAVEWVSLLRHARQLRDERNAIDCDRGNGYSGVVPCFKDFCVERGPEQPPDRRPLVEWCQSCQRRHVLHLAARDIRRAAGIANRRVQALCRGTERDRT